MHHRAIRATVNSNQHQSISLMELPHRILRSLLASRAEIYNITDTQPETA